MTLKQMQISMSSIVLQVSQKYPDGENYFTEIDKMVKNDKTLLASFCKYVYQQTHNPIVFSGEIGDIVFELMMQGEIIKFPIIVTNGGLRSGLDIVDIKSCPLYFGYEEKFTMIDDSYYSGKTVSKVEEYLQKMRINIENVFVFYDGSIEKRDNVFSLYRYYDEKE